MNLQNMNYKSYYYNFEIYNIKEAREISIDIDSKFKDCGYFDDKDIETMSKYQEDFKTLCDKLISKSINDIEEYVQITDALIIISAKSQKFLHKLRRKYSNRHNKLKKLADLQKKTDDKIGAESLLDLLLDAHISSLTIAFMSIGGMLLLYIGAKTMNVIALIIGLILILLLFIFFVFGNKIVKTSMNIDRLNRNINNHTYLKSLKMKQIYRYSKILIDKSIK